MEEKKKAEIWETWDSGRQGFFVRGAEGERLSLTFPQRWMAEDFLKREGLDGQ